MSDDKQKTGGGFFSNPTRKLGGDTNESTRKIGGSDRTQSQAPKRDLSSATRLARPGGGAGEAPDAAPQADNMVVGWLVVLSGPGKGAGIPLGYGLNSIGRDAGQRARLDFGDQEISRENHCSIAYDQRNRKFFIQHGGGQNLTYLGDQPVLAPTELASLSTISLGGTTLRFIAFCGQDFDWEDLENTSDSGSAP
ncbi:MAG: FHA domain-containing protein [Pseudomonadota bacterium]